MRMFFLIIGLSVSLVAADFTRNNGVVVDNRTGLQWQDDYSDNGGDIKSAKWTDAIAYCEDLTLGGHSDWRLPNKKELLSIVDYGRYEPAINATFTHTTSSLYWSSTTRAGDTDHALIVFFMYGDTLGLGKSGDFYVRCVRDGE